MTWIMVMVSMCGTAVWGDPERYEETLRQLATLKEFVGVVAREKVTPSEIANWMAQHGEGLADVGDGFVELSHLTESDVKFMMGGLKTVARELALAVTLRDMLLSAESAKEFWKVAIPLAKRRGRMDIVERMGDGLDPTTWWGDQELRGEQETMVKGHHSYFPWGVHIDDNRECLKLTDEWSGKSFFQHITFTGQFVGDPSAVIVPQGGNNGVGGPGLGARRPTPLLDRLGLRVRSMDQEDIKRAGLKEAGVIVKEFLSGLADVDAFQEGDIIVKVDGQAVHKTSEFREAIEEHEVGDPLVLTVRRAGKERTVKIDTD